MFSSHPDDETLACGGTILKALTENKKVKVVFMSNGDASSETASTWLKKKIEELTPKDYISLGEKRQEEALRCINKLGLKEEDVVFLSYPDNGLLPIWREDNLYKSKTTGEASSVYKKTYNRAKRGYTRENLLLDMEDILNKYQPKRIYTPYLLDGHSDHQATTQFVFDALGALGDSGKQNWIGSAELSYYLIHSPIMDSGQPRFIWPEKNSPLMNAPGILTEKSPRSENVAIFKQKKKEALEEYRTQLSLEEEKFFLENFVKDNEIFWDAPTDKLAHLNALEEEWQRIGKIMRSDGYNVNFGVVADVASDLEDMNNPLARKRRMYSEHPCFVTELAYSTVMGTTETGVISVVKHFPGLGSGYSDSHISLPKIEKSKTELYKSDLVPFKELINRGAHFWIMTSHAIYPSLSKEPASLSYDIQTALLRKKLGFKGIIIADELLNMQAIKEYAGLSKIKEPYLGEIICRAFMAGTDIALFYVSSARQAKELIPGIINNVKQAVREGRIKEEDLDASVRRILKDKEIIFKKPLEHFLKDMPLEEKIAQRLFTDTYTSKQESIKDWIDIFKEYNLGGILPRDVKIIPEAQNNSRIPLFIATQHEGGLVEYDLNLCTRSAYIMGKEFARLVNKAGAKIPCLSFKVPRHSYKKQDVGSIAAKLDKATRQAIFSSLLSSIADVIKSWAEMDEKGYSAPDPNYLSPLTIYSDGRFEIKPYEDMGDLPIIWLRKFPDEKSALCAYYLFKKTFDDWPGSRKRITGVVNIISHLKAFREKIEEQGGKKDKSWVRILCLAAHPDDEDGQALAYLGKKFNCQTYILLATRGEGGENETGPSLYEELGALRSQEIEKSAAILGVKRVYYLGKPDFGYCSKIEKAIDKWGKEDTLAKLVYFIRMVKPHIIITKHNNLEDYEHCQHRALISLAEEAFDLAGDSQAYPQMIKEGLVPWQPLKFYQRLPAKRLLPNDNGELLTIDTNEVVTSKRMTCAKIAKEALSQHLSQGALRLLDSPGKVFYQLLKSKISYEQDNSFFTGIQEDKLGAGIATGKGDVLPSGFPGVKIVKDSGIGLIEVNNNVLFMALKTLGCDFKSLDERFLKKGDLAQFKTIIMGEGVYNSFPALIQANQRLFEFVQKGGNLIIFSQSPEQIVFPFTPYVLKICFNPISDEEAPITILNPDNPLFNFPNQVSSQDFNGWRQGRALSLPFEYSKEYTELTSCVTDAGELSKGGYLVTDYGKGSYIYTGYSWYRQFREFNLGAYKNLANMLAYPYARKATVK